MRDMPHRMAVDVATFLIPDIVGHPTRKRVWTARQPTAQRRIDNQRVRDRRDIQRN